MFCVDIITEYSYNNLGITYYLIYAIAKLFPIFILTQIYFLYAKSRRKKNNFSYQQRISKHIYYF